MPEVQQGPWALEVSALPELVENLESLLAAARSGELRALAWAEVRKDHSLRRGQIDNDPVYRRDLALGITDLWYSSLAEREVDYMLAENGNRK